MSDELRFPNGLGIYPVDENQLAKGFETLQKHPHYKKVHSYGDGFDPWMDLFDDDERAAAERLIKTGSNPYGWRYRECECGAKWTSAPNLHLRWCPLFTEPIKE